MGKYLGCAVTLYSLYSGSSGRLYNKRKQTAEWRKDSKVMVHCWGGQAIKV
jgi:hypothetical protein